MSKEMLDMGGPKTPEEEQEINKKRMAYENALEKEGLKNIKTKIEDIIRTIRGGKLSPNGELLMELDAHLENDIRNESTKRIYSSKKYTTGNDALMFRGEITHIKPERILAKLQNSYLKTERVQTETNVDGDPFKTKYEIRIYGIINGENIEIIETRTKVPSSRSSDGDYRKSLVVKINGTKIADKDAEAIYKEYADVAYAQNAMIREDKLLRRLDNEQAEENKKNVQQANLSQKTKNLVNKILGKK